MVSRSQGAIESGLFMGRECCPPIFARQVPIHGGVAKSPQASIALNRSSPRARYSTAKVGGLKSLLHHEIVHDKSAADFGHNRFPSGIPMLVVRGNGLFVSFVNSQNHLCKPTAARDLFDMREQTPTEPAPLPRRMDVKFVKFHLCLCFRSIRSETNEFLAREKLI